MHGVFEVSPRGGLVNLYMHSRRYIFPRFFALGNTFLPYTYEQVKDYILSNKTVNLTRHQGYPVFYEWVLPILNQYQISSGPIKDIIFYLYKTDPISATLILHYVLRKHYQDNVLLSKTYIKENEEYEDNDIKEIVKLVVPFMANYYKGVGDRGYHTMIMHKDLVDHVVLLVVHRAILRQARNILHSLGYTLEEFVGRPYIYMLNTMLDHNIPEHIPIMIAVHLIYALYKYNSIYTQL